MTGGESCRPWPTSPRGPRPITAVDLILTDRELAAIDALHGDTDAWEGIRDDDEGDLE